MKAPIRTKTTANRAIASCAFLVAATLLFLVGALVSRDATPVYSASNAARTTLDEPQITGACALRFTDVPPGSTFHEFVQCLACQEVLSGYPDGTFRPGNNVTRGQLSKIVANAARLAGIPTSQTFQDVPPGSTFYDFVERMSGLGIISGYPCGGEGEPCVPPDNRPYFRPNASATRGQISKIVANAMGFNENHADQMFEDVPTSHTFYIFIQRLASRGVISGYPCGGPGEQCVPPGNRPYFRPHLDATRGQVAKIVSNAFFPGCKSAQSLINDAYDQGRIDYGTSLLYRAFALFGDRRLPREYIGTGSSGEDQALHYEYEVMSNTIPPAIESQLRPFMVRPDDPASIFSPPVSTVGPTSTEASKDGGSEPSTAVARPEGAIYCDGRGWAALARTPDRFKVWARCTGVWADPETTYVMTSVLELGETIWSPMTALMGPPVLDEGGPNGGGSRDIDIYIIDPLDSLTINGRKLEISGGAAANAPGAPPYVGGRASGYITLSRARINAIAFRNEVIHEFFHVLQSAHNHDIRFQFDQTAGQFREYWFVEASATWSEAHFDRTITNWPPRWAGRSADQDTHVWFSTFQNSSLPLHHSASPSSDSSYYMYAAYIWPFFIEQERGATAIAEAWRGIAGAGTNWEAATGAISGQLDFAGNFHRFAVRNLNDRFEGQNPIGIHYNELDSLFPEGLRPFYDLEATLPVGSEFSAAVDVPALKARYYLYHVDPEAQQVRFDFSDVNPNEELDVDALVRNREGNWSLRQLLRSGETPLCDVTDVLLVISNHGTDLARPLDGSFRVRAQSLPCTCEHIQPMLGQPWRGTATFNYEKQGTRNENGTFMRVTVRTSGDVSSNLVNWTDPPTVVTGTLNGVASINDEFFERDPKGNEETRTIIGSGPPLNGDPRCGNCSYAELHIYLDQCTYDLRVRADIEATASKGGEGAYLSGWIGIDGQPIGQSTTLSGNMSVSARYATKEIPFFRGGGFSGLLWIILGEGNLGNASVSWSFSPLATPTSTP